LTAEVTNRVTSHYILLICCITQSFVEILYVKLTINQLCGGKSIPLHHLVSTIICERQTHSEQLCCDLSWSEFRLMNWVKPF